ncbi:E3 ubiquitin-protein ligase MARCH5 [Choanephora cucurbitarum]|uniref:E3 ubiquitin-protein ligase MARCH5 n=1 Tax=Choanephora cucurbitarum TaxID=101091 RepID=A0A1C7NK33_9FUNG|nr:E3 ubiquitin-protein ligase MARCH5 [Choanephora cucurbitarum]
MSHFRGYLAQSETDLHQNSSDSSTILAPRQPTRTVDDRRCWICFGDSSDSQGQWIKPCQCSLEAHQSCLLDWIAENQKATPNKTVNCPQCATPYQLAQTNSISLALMTIVDSLVRTSTPYITVLGIGCSLLITCTTYGAFSVMTLFGPRDGDRLIGHPASWTYKTWIGLPAIPFMLISSRTRYGDLILPSASFLILGAAGTTPNHLRFTWPLSPAFTVGIMPWVRLFYKNMFLQVQKHVTKKLAIQPVERVNRSRNTNNVDISDREHHLELDIIQGRGSVGISLLGTLLMPVISSAMGSNILKS